MDKKRINKPGTILIIALAYLLTCTQAFAQSPEKMSYQAVVRDGDHNLITGTAIGMQISILKSSPTGTSVYTETQKPTTNSNGLVTVEIGTGTVQNGDFSAIDWANDTYFIKTEIDPAGGTNYSIAGTSQLISVSYALHAKTVTNALGLDNTTAFTPDADYEPATKKYVDDNASTTIQKEFTNVAENDKKTVTGTTIISVLEKSVGEENSATDFNAETYYTQEDAVNGTGFDGGKVGLHVKSGVIVAKEALSSKNTTAISYNDGIINSGTTNSASIDDLNAFIQANSPQDVVTDYPDLASGTAPAISVIVYDDTKISRYYAHKTATVWGSMNSQSRTGNNSYAMLFLEELIPAYPTTQAYYVTTKDDSQIKLKWATGISNITITQTEPANTTIKYLVSFDGRTTWKYWNGTAWTTATLADLQTNGMTVAALKTALESNWVSTLGATLDFAIDLKTTDVYVTPEVDNIVVSYTGNPGYYLMQPSVDYMIYRINNTGTQTISITKLKAGTADIVVNYQ